MIKADDEIIISGGKIRETLLTFQILHRKCVQRKLYYFLQLRAIPPNYRNVFNVQFVGNTGNMNYSKTNFYVHNWH